VIGRVAAGAPILAEPHVEARSTSTLRCSGPADYLLRVRGDSMIEAGILAGDLVAVHRTRRWNLESWRWCVYDEVTVKHWRPRPDGLLALEPRNAAMRPIVVDPSSTEVVVEGTVVGVLRCGAVVATS
jgi:repressor LexA